MLLVSCAVMTIGVIGIVRLPDVYTKLHAASKSVFLGVILLCISATVVATQEMVMRLALVGLVMTITTPLASHVIGRAAFLMHEQMETPGAVDESHMLIDDTGDANTEEPGWRL